MTKFILLLAVSVGLVGCNKKDGSIRESAGADTTKSAVEAQKDQIDSAAKEAKEQIKADAKAQQEKIEAEAKAAKAEIEAQKAKAEAQVKAEAKNLEAQSQKIEEAAGAAPKEQVAVEAKKEAALEIDRGNDAAAKIRASLGLQDKNDIEIHIEDGKVTLKGKVASETERADLEAKAKAFPGVTQVENKLEVK